MLGSVLSCLSQVAMGLPLHCIKDIRALYKKDLWGTSPIDFDKWVGHGCLGWRRGCGWMN